MNHIVSNKLENIGNQTTIGNAASLCMGEVLNVIITIALFTIGCVGAAGIIPGMTLGWATLGLALGCIAYNIVVWLNKPSIEIEGTTLKLVISSITNIAVLVMGALGASGVLSGNQIGWGIVGINLGALSLHVVVALVSKERRGLVALIWNS